MGDIRSVSLEPILGEGGCRVDFGALAAAITGLIAPFLKGFLDRGEDIAKDLGEEAAEGTEGLAKRVCRRLLSKVKEDPEVTQAVNTAAASPDDSRATGSAAVDRVPHPEIHVAFDSLSGRIALRHERVLLGDRAMVPDADLDRLIARETERIGDAMGVPLEGLWIDRSIMPAGAFHRVDLETRRLIPIGIEHGGDELI
jgi:hypothetical protein